ncbi:2-hydroxychromene-2-carboxylate isomerase [Qipengyuania citrea]|uniref:2-hydroxychromene-2-carboxylate isomerase n=1 Tax=Qipengyuania citrea TaxID=225971 RepID=A0ABY4U1U4_9SPHN|nr:2-hydroxychromene-2-carboxylate isomerase [Qipengyuania citrea]USA60084.1 2-hydroxychromene-2-carboxylate isomerase [Qipengyuania citrea]
MSDTVQFYYDFGSPNAYLAHRVLPQIEARTGANFQYVPILLGGLFKLTGNRPPMMAFAEVPNKLAYERREMERFIARHHLTEFTMNPHFPVNTLMLMRGAVAAEREGIAAPYVEAMFHFMWEEPRKLDDPAILRQTLTNAGLPAETLFNLAAQQDVKDELSANTQRAFDNGAFGSPSFVFEGELFFGKDKLHDVEALLTNRSS